MSETNRRTRRSKCPSTVVLVALCLVSASARAEGPGVKLGSRVVLHPGISVETSYDSNLFYEANNPTGSFLLHVLPVFDIATLPPQRGGDHPHSVDFRFHLAADYREYLTADSSIQAHRAASVEAGAMVKLLPFGKYSVDVFGNYFRTTRTPYGPLPNNIDRDNNEVGIAIHLKPGSGRIETTLTYAFGLDFFEITDYKDYDNLYHKIDLQVAWRFFPKTALYIDISEQPTNYLHHGPNNYKHADSYPLHLAAGVKGLITPKLTLDIFGGYTNGFYVYQAGVVSTPSPNTGHAGLTVKWKPTVMTSLGLQYRHDFLNALLGSFADVDLITLNWGQKIWRFFLGIDLEYDNLRYQGIPPEAAVVDDAGMPVNTRTDNYFTGAAHFGYNLKDYLNLSANYKITLNNPSNRLQSGNALVGADYLKHEVWLQLAFKY